MEHTSWPCCISYFKLTLEKSARLWSPARPPQMKSESRSRMRGQIRSKLRRNITEKSAALAPDERFQLHKKALNPLQRCKRLYIWNFSSLCKLRVTRIRCFTFYNSWFYFHIPAINSYVQMYSCHIISFFQEVSSHIPVTSKWADL